MLSTSNRKSNVTGVLEKHEGSELPWQRNDVIPHVTWHRATHHWWDNFRYFRRRDLRWNCCRYDERRFRCITNQLGDLKLLGISICSFAVFLSLWPREKVSLRQLRALFDTKPNEALKHVFSNLSKAVSTEELWQSSLNEPPKPYFHVSTALIAKRNFRQYILVMFIHQSIPAVPIPPRANPRALAFFFKRGRIPRGGDT